MLLSHLKKKSVKNTFWWYKCWFGLDATNFGCYIAPHVLKSAFLFLLSSLTSSSIISFLVHMAISFVSYLTRAQLLIHLLMEMDHSQTVVKKAEYASWINISALIFQQSALFPASLLRQDVCGCISKERNNEARAQSVETIGSIC